MDTYFLKGTDGKTYLVPKIEQGERGTSIWPSLININ